MVTSEQRSGTDRRHQATTGRRAGKDNQSRKNQSVVNISHEIRTPMHAILAMIDLLGTTPLTLQQARYVNIFKDAGEHLLSLSNELLDYSRLESDSIQLRNISFHLPRLLESVVDLMRMQLGNKNIVLCCNVDASAPLWRRGDPQRLRQILINLIHNAIKFTQEGEINIRLIVNAERVMIEVTDTGVGIPEAQQTQIFDLFVQCDVNRDSRLGGVGLGLAICKQLAKAMSGDITVKSTVGCGSTFVCDVLLPAASEAVVETPLTDEHPPSGQHLFALSILVVDDSLLNCRVMEDLLCQLGCTVTCVSNGQEAFMQFFSERYDLVLMDVRMPVMDGLKATRSIRHVENCFKSTRQYDGEIPIIALSASVDPDEKKAALAAGCSDHLLKPLRKETLTQVLLKLATNHLF